MPDHPDETARAARPLDTRCAGIFDALLGDHHAAHPHWQARLDAGLIGAVQPASPEIVAQRAANDALFRRIAADRRAAHQARSARSGARFPRRAIATARLAVRPHRGPGMPDGKPWIV